MKTDSTKTTSSALVLLFRLIEANDWQKINNMFLTDPEGQRSFKYLTALVAKSSSFNGMTILHACAKFNPPSLLVERIIELCPNDTSSQDCLDRTPLHVAAGTGASRNVIKVLVEAHPDACMVQDKDGRTPLHLACDSSCELFEDNGIALYDRPTPSYGTIGVLLEASLDSAVLEDKDGMSAIEYALFSNADLQVVQLIQRAARKKMLEKQEEEKANKAKGKLSPQRCNSAAIKKLSPRKPLLNAPSA
eukprot:CAMPEP_0172308290 /NCGR_PEP_ID=MMETSP1058-20130122/8934_1 /TAXON_ID=83371 /ORGANISM="Detonula confervacea, Strain CCMP 353" /LENGTH=247 /DNA_ID=CAMNT_0013020673 /DNA_START=135 /DNA_END=878 /DNA_ORIENTATION=-